MSSHPAPKTKITWDRGTGYDFLASLDVLHFPDSFGLRGAWAAGVRSRLPGKHRDFLEKVSGNFSLPLRWVHSLAEPRDGATVLLALKRIAPEERLGLLCFTPVPTAEMEELLQSVMQHQAWDEGVLDDALQIWRNYNKKQLYTTELVSEKRVEKILNLYVDPISFGQRYLDALQAYYEVFFSEEEKRIAPKLEQTLQKFQKKAEKLSAQELMKAFTNEPLSENLEKYERVTLVPSYWYSPWIMDQCLNKTQLLILFGARPPEESLVPGEIVPEELMLRLKAMTDPTRLRILRYLIQEQITPAELARRLRLRAPTVTHHLHALKQAGMVHFVKRGKNEHLYYAKMDSIKETYGILKEFLEEDVTEAENFNFLDNEQLF